MNEFETKLFKLCFLLMCTYTIWLLFTYNLDVHKKVILFNGFVCVNIVIFFCLLSKVSKIKKFFIELDNSNVDVNFYKESNELNKWQSGVIVLTMFEILNIFLFIYDSFNHQLLLSSIICANMFLLLTIIRALCHLTIQVIELEDL